MAAFALTLLRFKSFHSKAKLLALSGENAATAARITAQIDNLIHEYGKDKSKSAEESVLKRLNVIKAELDTLKTPPDIKMAFSSSGAMRKLGKHEMDIVLANFANAEMMRIYFEQSVGRLPPEPTPWRMVRPRVAQFRDAWILFGRQLRSAASQIDKDIASSAKVRDELKRARIQPGLLKEDIDLLTADYERMGGEESVMRADRDRLLQVAHDADAAADALQNLIELRDTFE